MIRDQYLSYNIAIKNGEAVLYLIFSPNTHDIQYNLQLMQYFFEMI